MFHRESKKQIKPRPETVKGLSQIREINELLNDNKRQDLLTRIRELMALAPARYESLVETLNHQLCRYVQLLPETSNRYYAQAGGLLDHALNRTEAALSLFKSIILPDKDSPLTEEQSLWQYVLFSAGLLQGIGKLYTEFNIKIFDANAQVLKTWNPLLENLSSLGRYYDYQFKNQSDPVFHRRLNVLMSRQMMPGSGFSWIASNPEALSVWLALLHEDERTAGTLGAILIRADAIALQRYFQDVFDRIAGHGGRHRRIGAFADGTPESLLDKEQKMAIEFLLWLQQLIENGKVHLNRSPLFMVPGGMIIGAEAFKLFVREHPEYKNWQALQKALTSLGIHKLSENGNLESRFEHGKTQQIHSGLLITNYAAVLPDNMHVEDPRTGKTSAVSVLELIHTKEYINQFVQTKVSVPLASIQQLNPAGQWIQAEHTASGFQPGARGG